MYESESILAYNNLREQLISDGFPIKATKTFGMPTMSLGRKVVAGYTEGYIVVKLPPSYIEDALEIPGAQLFDPMGGRPMKNWVEIPFSKVDSWRKFLEIAVEMVAG